MRKFYYKVLKKIISILGGRGAVPLYNAYVYNVNHRNYPDIGFSVHLNAPIYDIIPENVHLESFVRIQTGVRFIMNKHHEVFIKKYTAIGANSIIVPGSHTPTVGMPHFFSLFNDRIAPLIVNEDVWVGANSILLYRTNIGRGCIVAAGSVISREIPPYAVVGGAPAKIIAVRFSLEQIIVHEKSIYPESERTDVTLLELLFENEYKGLKVIGTSEISEKDKESLESIKIKNGIIPN